MGRVNLLVEGVSGTGKTSVCRELLRHGIQAFNGDTELAYQGDPATGAPASGPPWHQQHLWRESEVRSLAGQRDRRLTFFCGESRNHDRFLDVVDRVFVLDVDAATLRGRLERRPADEFGGRREEQDFILGLHAAGQDVPAGAVAIDAALPLDDVVDEILRQAEVVAGTCPRQDSNLRHPL